MQPTYSLADLFERVAATVPDRLAVICGDIKVTYAQLDERANRLAAILQQQGIGPGDTVGLQLYNGSPYLEGFLAACKLRALPVNINFRYVAHELRYIYENAELKALLCAAELDPIVDSIISDFPGIKVRLSSGEAYEAALAASSPVYEVPVRSDDDLSLLYTGGTTGMPKGVMWPHRALFFGALGGGGYYRKEGPIKTPQEIVDVVRNGYALRYLAVAPLMHGSALWASLASLFSGQTVLMRPELDFEAEVIWDLAEREQANIISIVGDAMAMPMLQALQAHPGRWDLSKIMHFGSGGGLFSLHLQDGLQAFIPNGKVADSIGSSEGGVLGSGSRPQSGAGFIKLAPRPDLKVMAEDRSRFVGPGEEGVMVRVGHVPAGYFGDPKKSAETFFVINGERCANTGDMARVEADGSIVVLGRGSQCINTGGEKVFPEEVEEVLHTHPAVEDALVVGIADERWGQRVSAVVSLRPGTEVSDAELKAFCREYLAGYKVPKTLLLVEQVSRSAAGKADYRWARARLEEAEPGVVGV